MYRGGEVIGFTSTSDISIGAQAGGQAYSQIIFFKNAQYEKGMAIFTMAKGGLMYAATIAGQKYTYKSVK